MKRCAFGFLPLLCLAALPVQAGNPVIRDRFTADPAALVHDGKVYLYVRPPHSPAPFDARPVSGAAR